MKRAIDITVAIIGLVVLWPVMLICSIAVKTTSRGSVFYRGKRTGQYGKPFYIWKFRSMVENAEQTGGTTTGDGDKRITSTGRILRKYKLDELPQLLNVLFGEMSLVGPRPEVAEYTDQYTEIEKKILEARPGITDLASIQFSDLQNHVGEFDPDSVYREIVLPKKNLLRLKYVESQSIQLDLKILAITMAVVLSKPFRNSFCRGKHLNNGKRC